MCVTLNTTLYKGSGVIEVVYPIHVCCSNFRYSSQYCAFFFTRWFDSPTIFCEEIGNNISLGVIVKYVLRKTGAKWM